MLVVAEVAIDFDWSSIAHRSLSFAINFRGLTINLSNPRYRKEVPVPFDDISFTITRLASHLSTMTGLPDSMEL